MHIRSMAWHPPTIVVHIPNVPPLEALELFHCGMGAGAHLRSGLGLG